MSTLGPAELDTQVPTQTPTQVLDGPSASPLFRAEVTEALLPRAQGEIILNPGRRARWLAWAGLALLAGLLALLVLGSYTRRTTVQGELVPDQGLLRISSPQGGVVLEQHADERRLVRRGEVLFVLSGERLGPDGHELQRGVADQLVRRRESLADERRRLGAEAGQEATQLARQQAALRAEGERLDSQRQLLEGRVQAAREALARYQGLFRQGYLSRDELAQREAELSEAQTRLEGVRREALALQREQASVQREAGAAQARLAGQRAELERGIDQVQQTLAEAEAQRHILVTAPADGWLTLVTARPGQPVEPQQPLAQLVPAQARLQARLYAPSRAAGFTQVGTPVLLRYDAYPYQQFGQHQGRVVAVAAAALPAQAAAGPGAGDEPVFPITVQLPAQSMATPTRQLPLQAGMRLQAELMHESRHLYQWALEPLFGWRARTLVGSNGAAGASASPALPPPQEPAR